MIWGFFMGMWPVVGFLSNLGAQEGGCVLLLGLAASLVVIDLYLIVPPLSKRYYLLVTTQSGTRRIPIEDCNPAGVLGVVRAFGYPVSGGGQP